MMQMKFAARRERLLDFGFTEMEIADVSEEGLNHVHEVLSRSLRKEKLRHQRGSRLHIAERENLIFGALLAEREMRGIHNGPIHEEFLPTPERLLHQAIGVNIAAARCTAHRSIDWMAHAMSCSHSRIVQIETGAVALSTSELAKVAKNLGVTVLDLIPTELRQRLQKPADVYPELFSQSRRSDRERPPARGF